MMPWAIALLAAFGFYTFQVQIDALASQRPPEVELMSIPDADQIRLLSVGHQQLAADLIWLQTIQTVGAHGVSCCYRWIYRAIDIVTDLDPTFARAYQFGGLLLSFRGPSLAMGDALFEKGEKHNPTVWELPFYRGFNDYFYRQNYAAAAAHVSRAARLPGSPSGLPNFAASLYVRSGSREAAIDFLGTLIDETDDETTREVLKARAEQLLSESPLPQ